MRRCTTFTEAKGARICALLAKGTPMRQVCLLPGMPSESTAYRWIDEDPVFRAAYMRARTAQAHGMLDEIIAIADADTGDLARDKLRVEARKWALARLAPARYHDRALDASAERPPGASQDMTPAQRRTRLEQLWAKYEAERGGGA